MLIGIQVRNGYIGGVKIDHSSFGDTIKVHKNRNICFLNLLKVFRLMVKM